VSRAFAQVSLLHASGAETADDDGADLAYTPDNAIFVLDITAYAGTSPLLDVTIEEKHPLTGVYFVIDTFPQQGEAVATIRRTLAGPIGGVIRASWDVAGSAGQSFTFSLSVEGKQDT